MGIETLPYPDRHTPAEGYTGISAGDVIRFSPLDRYGGPSDVEDCIVRDIECDPRAFTTGEAFRTRAIGCRVQDIFAVDALGVGVGI